MSRAEFMSASSIGAGIETGRQSAAVNASSGESTRGNALYREVQADVAAFIQNGSTSEGSTSIGAFASMAPSIWPAAAQRTTQADAPVVTGVGSGGTGVSAEAQRAFLEQIAPLAQKAGERLGVAPDIVAAQAALESGWGRRPLRRADGSDANNLFGLKAGGAWTGEVTQAVTHEQLGNDAVSRVEPFRSYGDASAGVDDYASLLADTPRYRQALGAGTDARAFANGLARGGYASDPSYADKLVHVAEQVRAMRARP